LTQGYWVYQRLLGLSTTVGAAKMSAADGRFSFYFGLWPFVAPNYPNRSCFDGSFCHFPFGTYFALLVGQNFILPSADEINSTINRLNAKISKYSKVQIWRF